ncbi:MAG TPA: glutamate racemase [Pseudorhodoplanes sp.]|jgi:glutamate racemase|nr:glutamate racemase [Pseudorhodoplanes sp.]
MAPTILVFDSGLGGLTVLREVAKARPDASLVYAADDAAFPYGAWAPENLSHRVVDIVGGLIDLFKPDLVVIACNTASTLALGDLRKAFALPFVGTVPAIKPACAASRSKLVSVLGTEVTVQREYTRALIRDFSQGCEVTLVGSKRLASLAEAQFRGEPPADDAIRLELMPCFIEKSGARTDTVVLACTHYPLLLDRLTALSPWPVSFVDPAPAIARRVVDLIGRGDGESPAPLRFHFTSGNNPPFPVGALAAFAAQPGMAFGKISSAPR